MESFDRRKYARILCQFKTKIRLSRLSEEIDGVTQNLSQGGAFVSSPSWPTLEKNDQAELRLFLPPDFTGQTQTLTLTGPGVLRRIEKDKEGVAVEFLRELKTFEPSW